TARRADSPTDARGRRPRRASRTPHCRRPRCDRARATGTLRAPRGRAGRRVRTRSEPGGHARCTIVPVNVMPLKIPTDLSQPYTRFGVTIGRLTLTEIEYLRQRRNDPQLSQFMIFQQEISPE